MNKKRIGNLGEAMAEVLLVERGYQIVARNFRCKFGEVDIIARKGGVMAFIEVKTRLSRRYGDGVEAVTMVKQQRIRRCAEYYLAANDWEYSSVDFQVIEISAFHLEGLDFAS